MESSTTTPTRRLRAGLAGGLICVGSALTMPYAMAAGPSDREVVAPADPAITAPSAAHPASHEPNAGFGPLGAAL
ncbi:hypothetical protein H9Y04_42215 [Streptomyces sp. TRM66268-LWL]|uniref:Uncharacterized protein n=1 Tax=Streptomyces polyasparticus TaxID=2767826 RepID=A0ABR7SW38_9ACTN|nr:hypothetical protein [Streptomyces polyasparticus]MBC9719147.1 hypothetical protein [Streptomyces polyasparticus]